MGKNTSDEDDAKPIWSSTYAGCFFQMHVSYLTHTQSLIRETHCRFANKLGNIAYSHMKTIATPMAANKHYWYFDTNIAHAGHTFAHFRPNANIIFMSICNLFMQINICSCEDCHTYAKCVYRKVEWMTREKTREMKSKKRFHQ